MSAGKLLAFGGALIGAGATIVVGWLVYALQSKAGFWSWPGILGVIISGVGFVTLVIGFFMPGDREGGGQVQRGGKHSINLQAGGDIYIGNGEAQVARLALPEQLVVGDIPQEPPGFRPRVDLMAELDRSSRPVSVVRAVTGMPGVGKTQLVAAYARACLADGWRLVAWVNASDSVSLLAGLAEVAEAAGLNDAGTGSGGYDTARIVRRRLEVDGEGCLVVFDNASEPDVLRSFLPASGAACVLITSSRQSVANLGVNVRVDVFSLDQALTFLAGRTGLADAGGATAVADELGYLPLALAQAAAVIAAQHLPYETYLDRLRTLPIDMYLTREEGQPYPRGIAEAILLSLNAVQVSDRTGVCMGVMEMMALLSPAGVRRDLLYVAGQVHALASGEYEPGMAAAVVDKALAQLMERSLLTFSLDGDTVIAHRVIMRVVRDGLAKQERLLEVCKSTAIVIDKHLQKLDLQDRLAVRDLAEQIVALYDNSSRFADEPDDELVRKLLSLRLWALKALIDLGDGTPQAIALGEPLIVECERVLGPDDATTLTARSGLAGAYHQAGRYADAIPLLEQTLAVRERLRGPDNRDTLWGSRTRPPVLTWASMRLARTR